MITFVALVAAAAVALVALAWPGHSSDSPAPTLSIVPPGAQHDGETVRIRISGVGQSASFEAAAREHPEIDPTTGDPRVVLCATPDDVDTCADASQRTSVPPSDELPVTASIELPRRLIVRGTTRDCAVDACSLQVQRTVVTRVRGGVVGNGAWGTCHRGLRRGRRGHAGALRPRRRRARLRKSGDDPGVTTTGSSPPNARTLARTVLGVPSVPPGFVTNGVNRVRAALGRVHAAMAPPPVRILEGLFGMLDHRVLVALCAAGVPDALTEPTRPAALARCVDADPAQLERLLRYASTRGWVRFDGAGRVAPTRVTAFLRADHPGGWRAWVEFAGGADVTRAVSELSTTARDGFAAANGQPFFDWMREHPDRAGAFDGAMAAGGRMHGLTLAAALDWSGRARVCDVGGGTGDLLATLLDLVPHLEGTVFDLPHVVERAVTRPRLEAVGGDAFVRVPNGFDTYLLVNVLHDWKDADAARMLRRVADAARPTGATVIVVDSDARTVPRADLSISADILMAALTDGGVERDTAAFGALGTTCGLRRVRSARLASGDLAHLFVPVASGPSPRS